MIAHFSTITDLYSYTLVFCFPTALTPHLHSLDFPSSLFPPSLPSPLFLLTLTPTAIGDYNASHLHI
jgi:hypothetical protein